MSKTLPSLDFLNYKAVRVQCLTEDEAPIPKACATGFIVKHGIDLYLYTCWHVVTGYDMNDVRIGPTLPNRRKLAITLTTANEFNAGTGLAYEIGGNQTITIPLYSNNSPLWRQNIKDTPHPDLNAVGIHVPYWHDLACLKLPEDLKLTDIQVIESDDALRSIVHIGEQIYIVGFPYGYSALGTTQPSPIVLCRHIAATKIINRHFDLLIDGPGAPGMSGAPIFIERGGQLKFFGIYTGIIYPDYDFNQNEKSTALGVCCNIRYWWESDPL